MSSEPTASEADALPPAVEFTALDEACVRAALTFWWGAEVGAARAALTALPLGLKVAPHVSRRWFMGGADVDAWIAASFGALARRASAGELRGEIEAALAERNDPAPAIVGVLLTDQFTRAGLRNTPEMFGGDAEAQHLSALLRAWPDFEKLPMRVQAFVCMPLMHGETREMQAESVAQFTRLASAVPDSGMDFTGFAKRHAVPVELFGRFPSRNKILGRETTPEEAAFLAEHPAGF